MMSVKIKVMIAVKNVPKAFFFDEASLLYLDYGND